MSKRKNEKRNWNQVIYLTLGLIVALSMVLSLFIGSCQPALPTSTPWPTPTLYIPPTDAPTPSPSPVPVGPMPPTATVTPSQ